MRRFYQSLSKKDPRRYTVIEAVKLGRGGLSYIRQLLGCDDEAMQLGKQEPQDDIRLHQNRATHLTNQSLSPSLDCIG